MGRRHLSSEQVIFNKKGRVIMGRDLEKRKQYDREYNIRNREKIKIYKKKWLVENAEYKREWNRAYIKKHKSRIVSLIRSRHLMVKFGITQEKYDEMFYSQDGCCAICGIHQSNLKRRLSTDHCHVTKNIRGLLCVSCNTGLGSFKDNIETLQKAIEYLQKDRSYKTC